MDNGPDWERLWRERPALLRLARRRSASREDAEDAVSEALVRAATAEELERPGAWLTRVTINLCADAARDRAHGPARVAYVNLVVVEEAAVDEAVANQDEAEAAARLVAGLPPRQREALVLRAAGLSVTEVAARMGVSYKTAESLLSRAREAVRARLADPAG